MTEPPFLPQGSGSRRAQALARRRRNLRAMAFAALALLLAGCAAAVVLERSGATHGSASGSRSAGIGRRVRRAAAPSLPTHSPTGLALGRRPFDLRLSDEGPVRVSFHHAPRAGVLFDLDSGRVLWELDPTRVLPIASLAKMMTALLVVRSRAPSTSVLVTRHAVDAPGSKIGLLPLHRRVPLETLLYGLLLPSGNDAAVALAESVAGSVTRFVAKMNAEAARLGLGCTRYASPDGLEDANSSCAADLAELAHVDLEQPRIATVARHASAVLPFPIKGGKLYLYNNNPLLRYGYPGATGLKTGETEAAGLCLVGTAERHGVRLGVVLLHSPELGHQATHLLNRGFEDVHHQVRLPEPLIPAGR
jgi:D-alanyl-D-alanine carboxypeptidase (penicillin-binding protein 5/6)